MVLKLCVRLKVKDKNKAPMLNYQKCGIIWIRTLTLMYFPKSSYAPVIPVKTGIYEVS